MKRLMVMLVVVVVASACSGESSTTSDGPVDATTSSSAAQPAGVGSDAPERTTTTTGAQESGTSISLSAPCSFLSDSEMSEILGKEVTREASGDLLCIYAPADGSGGIELLLQDVAEVGCELVFSVGGFDDDEPVEGVGTYANYKASGISQMAVCYDEQVTLTTTMYAEPSDPRAVLTAVATAVEQGLS